MERPKKLNNFIRRSSLKNIFTEIKIGKFVFNLFFFYSVLSRLNRDDVFNQKKLFNALFVNQISFEILY